MQETKYTLAYYRDNELMQYPILVSFDGPEGNVAARRARAEFAMTICAGDKFNDSLVNKSLKKPTARIGIMYISLPSLQLAPDRLIEITGARESARTRTSIAIGFYMFHEQTPCALEYICLRKRTHGLGLGVLLFNHYEQYVRRQTS